MNWPKECLESRERFGQPHAILFPLIGKAVNTPKGEGVLFSVFWNRAYVLLGETEDRKLTAFNPKEVRLTEEA